MVSLSRRVRYGFGLHLLHNYPTRVPAVNTIKLTKRRGTGMGLALRPQHSVCGELESSVRVNVRRHAKRKYRVCLVQVPVLMAMIGAGGMAAAVF